MYGSFTTDSKSSHNTDTGIDKNKGVTCCVETCGYHGSGDSCHATNIQVGKEYAVSKDDTFCGTFKKK